MPWLAIDYKDETRKALIDHFDVQGFPRIVVLDAQTGVVLEESAVGKALDVNLWRSRAKSGGKISEPESPTVEPAAQSACCAIL
mmetsp:Transcript_22849/g.47677  ORF Transcript_22849/g.47677 Transcript_22849/m.47677 type:complete len:84 (+) Transcript_22849:161-412(+)